MSPSARTSRSPTTTSAAGSSTGRPSRITRACGAARDASAVIARSARTSSKTPTAVFTTTTSRMTVVSAQSPVATVKPAATRRTRISGSRSCATIRRHSGVGGAAGRTLAPCRWRRSIASFVVSPERAAVSWSTLEPLPGTPAWWLLAVEDLQALPVLGLVDLTTGEPLAKHDLRVMRPERQRRTPVGRQRPHDEDHSDDHQPQEHHHARAHQPIAPPTRAAVPVHHDESPL